MRAADFTFEPLIDRSPPLAERRGSHPPTLMYTSGSSHTVNSLICRKICARAGWCSSSPRDSGAAVRAESVRRQAGNWVEKGARYAPRGPCAFPAKSPKPGSKIHRRRWRSGGCHDALFELASLKRTLSTRRHMPLPPYIDRPDGVRSRALSDPCTPSVCVVAAPTAGLAFRSVADGGHCCERRRDHVSSRCTLAPVPSSLFASRSLKITTCNTEWLEVGQTWLMPWLLVVRVVVG